MERRFGKISIGHSGGTASANSNNYKISVPSSWISELGITPNNRDIVLNFDGKNIIISRKLSMEEFRAQKVREGHEFYAIKYYDRDILCTLIYADFTDHILQVENYTNKKIKTAFGANELPGWDDLIDFLEERCVPRQRDGIREYLETIGLDVYEPIEILKKTSGRMAEDEQWLEMEILV